MKATAKQIGYILLASAALSVGVNVVHPRRIPWVQDWSRQVEAQAAKQDIKVIPLTVALERFRCGESLFVDARSAIHFAQGHISAAVSVPFEQFDELFPAIVDLIDSGRELVVYCSNRECDDALLLASRLKEIGGSNTVLYIDGFEMWEKHGGATSSLSVEGVDAVPPVGDDL